MRAVDIIYDKRQGRELEPDVIRWLVESYVADKVPDYQLAAFLMAVFFKGMTSTELSALVESMMRSGEIFDWSRIDGPKVDKHSTGGVGDKVSLILAPLAAACGLVVPMVSGRGLGHSGGTLDKLESIEGFNVNLSSAEMGRMLRKIGVSMIGQTEKFVPADKRLYALRDVTATVESIPLIAASIMSKKLAEGAEGLVLDIKVGNGAFMNTPQRARELARVMIGIGHQMGRQVAALLTDMNQPLGMAVGNANEVVEAIETLRGGGPRDLREVTYALTARMLTIGGVAADKKAAMATIKSTIDGGAALEKFRRLIEAHGGDPRVVDEPRRLPSAPREAVVTAPRTGWLTQIDTRQVGIAAGTLGAGRRRKEDAIDHGVGLWYHARIGQMLQKGEPLFTARFRKEALWDEARPLLENCFTLGPRTVRPPKLIKAEIE